jgi:Uma2 family endonuclease
VESAKGAGLIGRDREQVRTSHLARRGGLARATDMASGGQTRRSRYASEKSPVSTSSEHVEFWDQSQAKKCGRHGIHPRLVGGVPCYSAVDGRCRRTWTREESGMSAAVEPGAELAPEDLLTLPDGADFELVGGKLVERHVSTLTSVVAVKLARRLDVFCEPLGLGWVLGPDAGFPCFPDAPNKVRRPDVSFVRRERLGIRQLAEGFVRVAPDLAVEVVSPRDLAYEVEEKIEEYLAAGVRLVWVVNPQARSVRIHRLDGSVSVIHAADALSGEDVIAGFACRVGELFPTDDPA